MVTPSVGAVVLVPFPFSDLSQSKRRPAVALAAAGRGDWILCQVTSRSYGDPMSIRLTDESFQAGTLHRTSYARPGKLFTAHERRLVSEIGVLRPEVLGKIVAGVVGILGKSR